MGSRIEDSTPDDWNEKLLGSEALSDERSIIFPLSSGDELAWSQGFSDSYPDTCLLLADMIPDDLHEKLLGSEALNMIPDDLHETLLGSEALSDKRSIIFPLSSRDQMETVLGKVENKIRSESMSERLPSDCSALSNTNWKDFKTKALAWSQGFSDSYPDTCHLSGNLGSVKLLSDSITRPRGHINGNEEEALGNEPVIRRGQDRRSSVSNTTAGGVPWETLLKIASAQANDGHEVSVAPVMIFGAAPVQPGIDLVVKTARLPRDLAVKLKPQHRESALREETSVLFMLGDDRPVEGTNTENEIEMGVEVEISGKPLESYTPF
ncbi:hypothetical protein GUITHDRAFT_148177 [Guillardia theta CCMP2712]|uniref:Uncharacterized protein n=1 Tax=Guillardia theta (strain CCMP2712) TaxID=905079 RepID=L1IAE3_GUITC|nr:hypothetical protein GUITHDRAFT_148177 [Guillardia theta CCMP2712]EKX33082.1 hypothetical protein GUITHDRAFT_148177 [Guillardia theta CCMP2712]|eukprot:XP_005820062.1 hypothetical protein GUITHDRAFT_148177 [Guillardia theta CCMP2712]